MAGAAYPDLETPGQVCEDDEDTDRNTPRCASELGRSPSEGMGDEAGPLHTKFCV